MPQGVTINGVALNSSNITINAVDSTARIASSEKGVANGVATLDSGGKVPTSQLPSYVDDVKEYANLSSFPATGETDKLYLAIDTGNIYRWSGSQYVQINNSVSSAESAVKDGNGNTITTTYATKTELSTAVPADAVFTDTKVTNTLGTTTKFYVTGTTSATTNTGG